LATRQTDSRARPRKAAPRRAGQAGRQAVRQSMSTAIRRAAVGRLIDRRPPLPAQHRPPVRPSTVVCHSLPVSPPPPPLLLPDRRCAFDHRALTGALCYLDRPRTTPPLLLESSSVRVTSAARFTRRSSRASGSARFQRRSNVAERPTFSRPKPAVYFRSD